MSKKEIVYEQPSDYAVISADNIILQLGDNNPKLIFYQEVTKINEGSDDIEKGKKFKRLKFEVRLPPKVLENLSKMYLGLIQARNFALESTKGNNNQDVTRSWWEVEDILRTTVYDTENITISSEDLVKLSEASINLGQRLANNIKNDKNEPK
jgi:hypothetical protein